MKERLWFEYSDDLQFIDGTSEHLRLAVSEEDPDLGRIYPHRRSKLSQIERGYRPILHLCYYTRNFRYHAKDQSGWDLFGKYRIERYWAEFEGRKVFKLVQLKVLTGEALPGVWIQTEDPFSEEQKQEGIFGMVIRRDLQSNGQEEASA